MRAGWVTLFTYYLLVSSTGVCAELNYYLPLVADGQSSDGSIRTTFIFLNTRTSVGTVQIRLTREDGSPMPVSIGDLGRDSAFSLSLGPGETRTLQTEGTGTVTRGAARVITDAKIGVSAILSTFDLAGNLLTEAGIDSSPGLTGGFVVPVESAENFNTGLALFNAGSSAVLLRLHLVETSGQERARTTVTLDSGAHFAKWVTGPGDFFPSVGNFRGTLRVFIDGTGTFQPYPNPVAAVAFRQSSSPLSFTTLPVLPIDSQQLQFQLPQVVNGSFPGGSIRTSFVLVNTSFASDFPAEAKVNLSLTKNDGTPWSITIPGIGTESTFSINLQKGASVFLETDGLRTLSSGAAIVTSNVPIGVAAVFTTYDAQGRFVTETGFCGFARTYTIHHTC